MTLTAYVNRSLNLGDILGDSQIVPRIYGAVGEDHFGRPDSLSTIVGICVSDALG